MNAAVSSQVVLWLKAAGEPTRLRLLALCAEGALTVSDLAQAVRQSEPRVSRHLKILCGAGLLARMREGQWVRHGLADDAGAAAFVRGLLLQLDRRDPVLLRDRAEARALAAPEGEGAPAQSSRLDRALRAFLEAAGAGAPGGGVLVVGSTHPDLLGSVTAGARDSTVIAPSRRAAQAARAFAERRGFTCRVLTAQRPGELTPEDLARSGGPFDAVLVDVPCSNTGVLGRRLEVRWRLRPGDFTHLVRLQTKLLLGAGERVRPGGVVVYSTCSIEPEENQQVVQTALQGLPGFVLEGEEEQVPGRPADGGYWARLRRKER